jgi:branched-subunit amino acid transport protein
VTGGWELVVWVGAATILIKAVGPLVLGPRSLPSSLGSAAARLAPALFGGLIATQVFTRDRAIGIDARAGGAAVSVILAGLGAPPIVVVLGAMAATAAIRGIDH